MAKRKTKAPVLDTEYLYPPVAPGQEPILLQPLPLDKRIDRAIEMNLDKLEYERARADAAVEALEAKRADAIQHHVEMLNQFIDMVNQRDGAEKRARSLESQVDKLEMAYATAQQNAEEWQKLCNAQMNRANSAEAVLRQITERVVNDETTTEKLAVERMENKYSVPRTMIGALLNIIRNERMARMQAETTLAEMRAPCVWTYIDVGWYKSSCGSDYSDVIGGYCSCCGHPIDVVISEGYE